MPTIPELLQAAAMWCSVGQFAQAEQAYRKILQLDPDHAEARKQLGLIAGMGGSPAEPAPVETAPAGPEQAMETALRQALEQQPDAAEGHANLGNILYMQGRLPEAEAAYREALRLQPDLPEAQSNLGMTLCRLGRPVEGEAAFREALKLRPNYPEAFNNLGSALCDQGKPAEAEVAYREALRLKPDYADAHANLGDALRDQGRFAEAEEAYRAALKLRPDSAGGLNNLGHALMGQGRLTDAEAAYRDALRLAPNAAELHANLGIALQGQGRLADAEAAHREAIRLRPTFAAAHNNLGSVLRDLGRPAEVEAAYREALRLQPDYADAHTNLGEVFRGDGRLVEAESAYREAIRLRPNLAAAHNNLALVLLSQGKFAEGWDEYEWRFRAQGQPPRNLGQPAWDGAALPGGSVLISVEQGMGDILQFVRYAALVKQRVGTVIVECPAGLVPLLSRCPGIDKLVAQGSPLPPFDAHAALLSLPRLFGTTLETIPAPLSYLAADGNLARRWRDRLSPVTGFRVGIAWQGNPDHPEQYRFMPLRSFAPLAAVPGVSLVSLQKGAGSEQIAGAGFAVHDLGSGVDESAGTFMDTAAVMKNLDLIVTADTAIGHLGGALGMPTWFAMSHVANWRWLEKREDSPWYPSVRLFRQSRPGEWDDVFERLAAALRERVG